MSKKKRPALDGDIVGQLKQVERTIENEPTVLHITRMAAGAIRLLRADKKKDTALIAELAEALEALRTIRTMRGSTPPEKLDAALTWRENDEKARALGDAALAKARSRT